MKKIIPFAEDSESIKTFFNHIQENAISMPSATRQRHFGNITHTPSHSIPLSVRNISEEKDASIISTSESAVNQARSELIHKKSEPQPSGIKRGGQMSEVHSRSGKRKTSQHQAKKHEGLIPIPKKKKKHQELKTIF